MGWTPSSMLWSIIAHRGFPMSSNDTILLIEDDHDIRVSFRQTLETSGHFIYSVANGKDALTLLGKISPPKLIILDLGMPIMNGEEFLALKEKNPMIASIPVLIVSCYIDRIQNINKYPFMVKPVDMDKFLKKVSDCLDAKIET